MPLSDDDPFRPGRELTLTGSDASTSCFPIASIDGVEVVGTWLVADDACETALRALLSDEQKARADRFLAAAHRRHYILAHGRLRQLIAARSGLDATSIVFRAGAHGKPRIDVRDASVQLNFNMSHSGELAVYAFSSDKEVGVDIEMLRSVPDAVALARRYFTTEEAAAISARASQAQVLAFLACWTRKEAFVKALGAGLNHPLCSFEVTVDPDEPAAFVRIENSNAGFDGWQMHGFQVASRAIGAVVYR